MNCSKAIESIKILKNVQLTAQSLRVDCYVVGGFVRDYLLEKQSKDIDIVCLGDGIALAKAVAASLDRPTKVHIFKTFGTAMLKYKDVEIEFVGARKESYQKDSRKPQVVPGTLVDDQLRRDFTINALAISLNSKDFGKLLDSFNGLKDLDDKIIRTPNDPEVTFSDDPLRMLRAIRFASQLHFDIEPDTFAAITNNLDRLKIVSQERIVVELNKIVASPQPSYGFKLLFHSGILKLIFPEMVALQGVETIKGRSHKDNFYHTLQVLDNVAKVSDDLWLRWSAILHDIAKPPTKRFNDKVGWTFHGHEDKGARMVPGIFRKMRLPLNDKMKFVQKLVRLHLRPIALVKEQVTDSALRRLLFEAGDDLEALMILCRADITSKNHDKVKKYLRNFDRVERKLFQVEEKDKVRNFQPVITGEHIMEVFALKPSKLVGEMKEALKEAVLEGKIRNDFQEAYEYLLTIAKDKGLKPIKTLDIP
ncbi:MAG: CCA tRNA nucleotidyltransferase [Cyclobacteriaceae bacterium]